MVHEKRLVSVWLLGMALAAGGAAQSSYVLPSGFDQVEGKHGNGIPLANPLARYQQVLPGGELPTPQITLRGLALRGDGGASANGGIAVDLELGLSVTPLDWNGVSRAFDQNYGTQPLVVFRRKHLDLPALGGTTGPEPFSVAIYFDAPFVLDSAQGNLLLEMRVFGNSNANKGFTYPLDAVWNGRETIPANTTRIYSTTSPDEQSGTLGRGYGLVWQLLTAAPAMAYRFGDACASSAGKPSLSMSAPPKLGTQAAIQLASAPAHAIVGLCIAKGRDDFGGSQLPIDLGTFGAPGCFLHVDPVHVEAATADAAGAAAMLFTIPNDPSLMDGRVYAQWLIIDSAANALGLVTSAGLAVFMR
jgi:hypothetical protein